MNTLTRTTIERLARQSLDAILEDLMDRDFVEAIEQDYTKACNAAEAKRLGIKELAFTQETILRLRFEALCFEAFCASLLASKYLRRQKNLYAPVAEIQGYFDGALAVRLLEMLDLLGVADLRETDDPLALNPPSKGSHLDPGERFDQYSIVYRERPGNEVLVLAKKLALSIDASHCVFLESMCDAYGLALLRIVDEVMQSVFSQTDGKGASPKVVVDEQPSRVENPRDSQAEPERALVRREREERPSEVAPVSKTTRTRSDRRVRTGFNAIAFVHWSFAIAIAAVATRVFLGFAARVAMVMIGDQPATELTWYQTSLLVLIAYVASCLAVGITLMIAPFKYRLAVGTTAVALTALLAPWLFSSPRVIGGLYALSIALNWVRVFAKMPQLAYLDTMTDAVFKAFAGKFDDADDAHDYDNGDDADNGDNHQRTRSGTAHRNGQQTLFDFEVDTDFDDDDLDFDFDLDIDLDSDGDDDPPGPQGR